MTQPAQRLAAAVSDRYRIERQLGEGGMATVWLAADLRHDRRVAIKLLRPELSAIVGAERFLQEIKVTAGLQHPHILPLYDSGSADGLLYYVMPYVEGETLRDRLEREGQLPVADAVSIGRSVASALDYAHRKGVIHRDIKPENILLHDGQALVADFGIALALSQAAGERLTQTGLSLGTPAYMSPEQATGSRHIDARTDIYALGCVVYEMLAGEPPHTGPTAQAVIAKIVTETPARVVAVRASVPAHVEEAIHIALAKLPADRFGSAAEFGAMLAGTGDTARTSRPSAVPSTRRSALLVAGTLLAGSVIGWIAHRPARAEPVAAGRFSIEAGTAGFHPLRTFDITPDGRNIVWAFLGQASGTTWGIMVRPIGELEGKPLPGLSNAVNPRVSPDGRSVLVSSFGNILRVPLAGGTPTEVRGVPETPYYAWASDDQIIFRGPDGGLWSVPGGGGAPVRLIAPDTLHRERAIDVTDVVDGLALGMSIPGIGGGPLVAYRLKDPGALTVLVQANTGGGWYAGHETLVYVADGMLWGVQFDPRRAQISGEPVALGGPVASMPTGGARVATSRNGSVLYAPRSGAELLSVTRDGATRRLLTEAREYHSPRFSPDGRSLSFDFTDPGGRDVWVLHLGQGTLTRGTFENSGHDAVWTNDGRGLLYMAVDSVGIAVRETRFDGSRSRVVARAGIAAVAPPLPDGRLVAAAQAGSAWDLLGVNPGGRVDTVLATPFTEAWPAPSPDGRWLAYVSTESRVSEVYLRRMDGGAKIQISLKGGTEPQWNRNGHELFYRTTESGNQELIAVELNLTGPAVVSRKSLFRVDEYIVAEPHVNYDVAPDGKSFVFVRRPTQSALVLIQNVQVLVRPGRK